MKRHPFPRRLGLLLVAALVSSFPALVSPAKAEDQAALEFFEAKIRPVLIKECYSCHSSQAPVLKGALNLEHRSGWQTGGDSGPSIVPGNPEDSLLLAAMKFDGLEMPPAGRLPDETIADFEAWIKAGAVDPREGTGTATKNTPLTGMSVEAGKQFWSFQPVTTSPLPEVRNAQWATPTVTNATSHQIDTMILARLEAANLAPSPAADERTLVRRLYLDLIGLAPTAPEVDAFIHDQRPDRLERLVDTLLERPEFAEHWARRWLDIARYADSNGSDFNATFKEAWRYRDYVIDALSRDLPYDEFIREQLAGDLLPAENEAERVRKLVATGFLMIGPKMLSERDKVKLQMDVVDEQLDTVGKAFLGMTMGCARCHDHKFDPIPTADYYAMAGILRNTLSLQGEIQKYVSDWPETPLPIAPEHQAALDQFEAARKALQGQLAAIKKQLGASTPAGTDTAKSELDLGVVIDDSAAEFIGEWKSSVYSRPFVGAGYRHDDNADKGEKSATFRTTLPSADEYEIRIAYTGSNGRSKEVPIEIVHVGGIAQVTLNQQTPGKHGSLLQPIGRFRFTPDQPATVTIRTAGTKGHVIVDAVQWISVKQIEAHRVQLAEAAKQAEANAEMERLKTEMKQMEGKMAELLKSAPPPAPKAMAARNANTFSDCPICIRGEPHQLGKVVPRGFLQVASWEPAPTIPTDVSGRRELADWIAHPKNPLTARVYVNRVWKSLLGSGIVRTTDNFGVLGEKPTHPELLDALASSFVHDGWSTKRLIRGIVLSRTYQQSSTFRDEAAAVDPENKLVWRSNRQRLSAESMRDSLLRLTTGFQSPPADSPVKALGKLVAENNPKGAAKTIQEAGVRTIYLPVIRGEISPLLAVFDFADPDFVVGERSVSTVPAQALVMLNSPFVKEAARQIAQQVIEDPTVPSDGRANAIYQRLLSRPADTEEIAAAAKLAGAGDLAGWSRVAHAIIASTEFRWRD